MRNLLADLLSTIARKIRPKAIPSSLTGGQWSGTSYVDSFMRNRDPNSNELLAELKNTAFSCASINAAVCAAYPPRLYVATRSPNEAEPRCFTIPVEKKVEKRLRSLPWLPRHITKANRIDEVLDHPLLTLLLQVNPVHNSFDLWELTTLYQEVHGSAYWNLEFDGLGIPKNIWILPSQNVTPKREPDSPLLVDYYQYRTGTNEKRFRPEEIIHFRYPNPRDPYTSGLGPLRAIWEQQTVNSDFAAFKKARLENRAIPDAIVSADEVMGEEERDRLESQWNSKFRRGGAGKVVVSDHGLRVNLLNQSLGDVALLADMKANKEDIANAFHVPISFFTTNTNLANLLASQSQHMSLAISPRLIRRDEKLNEQLLPLYDPTGRLFVASEDPIPVDADAALAQKELDLKYGVVTINEVRTERGLTESNWGNQPWLPLMWAPTDLPERPMYTPRGGNPQRGRSRDPKKTKPN
jgi:HK97 family phage portal protein